MNTTFNPYRRMLFIIMVIALFVTALGMACDKTENPCANGSACGLTAPAGELQQAITDAVKNSCQKDANGNCLTMDQTNHSVQCTKYDVLGMCLDN